jgi:hypothetical protein
MEPQPHDNPLDLWPHLSDQSSWMNNTTKTQNAYGGFGIEITESTDLVLAMLIAESEDGHYVPVAVVANIREAREVARSDFRDRERRFARGGEGMCPHVYTVWARAIHGGTANRLRDQEHLT